MLEITIKGEAREIAALTEALQGRRIPSRVEVKIDLEEIFKGVLGAMHDKPQGSGT